MVAVPAGWEWGGVGIVAMFSNTVAAVMNPLGWSGYLAPIIAPIIWALIAIAYRWFRMRSVSSP